MGCDNLLSQLTHVVVFLMRMGCLVAHRHDCMKLKATDQAAVFLTRWEWECVNMWTLWHHRLCCLNSIIIIPLWLMSCCSVLHAVSPGCTLLLRIAHESHVSCVMCVSTKDKKTAWALWCFFFYGRDNIVDMVSEWHGWTRNSASCWRVASGCWWRGILSQLDVTYWWGTVAVPSGCLPSTSVITLQHLSSHSVGCLIVFIIRSHLLSFKWKFLMWTLILK